MAKTDWSLRAAADEYERPRLCEGDKVPSFNDLLLDIPRDDGVFERFPSGLSVAARNVRHFAPTGVGTINPFSKSSR